MRRHGEMVTIGMWLLGAFPASRRRCRRLRGALRIEGGASRATPSPATTATWLLGACMAAVPAAEVAAQEGCFGTPKGVYAAGDHPQSVAVGDLTGDGAPDLAGAPDLVVANHVGSDTSHAQGTNDNEAILEVATNGYMAWLQKIPVGQEEGYGFENRGEFRRATLGQSIPMVTIDPDSVDLDGDIRAIDTFRVPILVDGNYRSLLTVAFMNGAYRIVDLGAAGLANELGEFGANSVGTRNDTKTYILRMYQLRSDFLVVTPKGMRARDGDFYPMRSARTFLDISADPPAIGEVPAQRMSAEKIGHGELVHILRRNFDRVTTAANQ